MATTYDLLVGLKITEVGPRELKRHIGR